MMNLFKKKKMDLNLYSPINGECIAIEDVPDNVFANKMMGNGVGFILKEDNQIFAPCDGIISVIAGTKHAIGLQADSGLEVLIHIGLDTVNLQGKGFEVKVKQGDRVTKGQPLISVDLSYMKQNEINLITPMVITNSSKIDIEIVCNNGFVKKGETIIARKN